MRNASQRPKHQRDDGPSSDDAVPITVDTALEVIVRLDDLEAVPLVEGALLSLLASRRHP